MTKMAESYPNGQKTLWEKEKLLVTSNFSFSHSVFKRLVSQGRQKESLCGNGLRILRYRLHRKHYGKKWNCSLYRHKQSILESACWAVVRTGGQSVHKILFGQLHLQFKSKWLDIWQMCSLGAVDVQDEILRKFHQELRSYCPWFDLIFACPDNSS